MKPFISIITPHYNGFDLLRQTHQSVLSQVFRNFEMIIVDDCSNQYERLKEYSLAYPHIHLERLKQNAGPSAARNRGIDLANGEIICFLDADDLWPSTFLQNVAEAFENKNIDVVVSKGITFSKRLLHRPLNNGFQKITNLTVYSDGVGSPSGVGVRKSALAALRFDESLRLFEDYLLYIQLAQNVKFQNLNNIYFYRIEGQNFSFRYPPGFLNEQIATLKEKLKYDSLTRTIQLRIDSVINTIEDAPPFQKVFRYFLYIVSSPQMTLKFFRYFLFCLVFFTRKAKLQREFEKIYKYERG